ncbi:Hypothetical predicted protein [Octopus vulgaris]|uniref:Uncharacterized protein n=1 Tax=Octopus vulgaris TaxID=6645 RepID=A0AA36AXB4_OCTVU|nr:Hypothetical predicted protein [Octopus vulgaris]
MNVVYSEGKQYSSVDELETAIKKAGEELPFELLQKLIGSRKSQVFEVIKKEHFWLHSDGRNVGRKNIIGFLTFNFVNSSFICVISVYCNGSLNSVCDWW